MVNFPGVQTNIRIGQTCGLEGWLESFGNVSQWHGDCKSKNIQIQVKIDQFQTKNFTSGNFILKEIATKLSSNFTFVFDEPTDTGIA